MQQRRLIKSFRVIDYKEKTNLSALNELNSETFFMRHPRSNLETLRKAKITKYGNI